MGYNIEVDGPYIIDRDEVTLNEWKAYKMGLVDDKSGDMINQNGFQYNGKTFSLRKTAQLNILGAERKKEVVGVLPITFNTIDNMNVEVLSTVVDVDNFFMAALVAKKTILDAGTSLKDSMRSAADKDAVDAIIDNR